MRLGAGNLAAMDPSRVIPAQVSYWDSVAGEKRFWHPLRLAWLTRYIGSTARILDFGCGYEDAADLVRAGYKNVIGVDFSFRMLACCRSQLPNVRLVQNYGQTIPLQKHSVNLVLLLLYLLAYLGTRISVTCYVKSDECFVRMAFSTSAIFF